MFLSSSIIAALKIHLQSQTSKRVGIFVVILLIIHFGSTPKIESYGPTIPTSVSSPVPFSNILASLV